MFVEVSDVNGECKVVVVFRKSSLHALASYIERRGRHMIPGTAAPSTHAQPAAEIGH